AAANQGYGTSQGSGGPRPPGPGEREGPPERSIARGVLPSSFPPHHGHHPVPSDRQGERVRRDRQAGRRGSLRPGGSAPPRHRQGPDRDGPQPATRVEERGPPHPRPSREGTPEVRPEEGREGAAVLEALVAGSFDRG